MFPWFHVALLPGLASGSRDARTRTAWVEPKRNAVRFPSLNVSDTNGWQITSLTVTAWPADALIFSLVSLFQCY